MTQPQLSEAQQRENFVREWLLTGDPFKAAQIVFPNDTGKALRISFDWPNDASVMALRQKFIDEEGADAILPNKEELAVRVLRAADNKAAPLEHRIKGYELYAKIRGFIEKPVPNSGGTQFNQTWNVMVVKAHGSDDDWERDAAAQQKRLIESSATKN